MNPSEFTKVFRQLDEALVDNDTLWRPRPFTLTDLPWCNTHPRLKEALLALSDLEACELHRNPQARVAWFRQYEPDLCDLLYGFEPPCAVSVTNLVPGRFDNVAIPGRKWAQVTAFASALPHSHIPLVDWCAGKGHLSRTIQNHQQQTVHCLEWDAALVASGLALAKKQRLDIQYHHHDVTEALPAVCSEPETVHIGLHACGDLNAHMLRHVVASSARAVALSPCCYHKIAGSHYQPLSAAAKASKLVLDSKDLHLAVEETATGGRGERLLREQERLWRLGFDELQRDCRSCDRYLNVPSIKRSLLRDDFPAFCRWAAKTRELQLPTKVDYDAYLQRGREKYRQVFRLELLRRIFNRPLELWLVLDRALYLEEQGYRVSVCNFCDSEVSPRNILIRGQRAV